MNLIDFLLARIAEDEAVQGILRSPARVLAECEAKRRIVELAADAFGNIEAGDYADDEGILIGRGGALSEVLTALALPYADHPDYRQEWRP